MKNFPQYLTHGSGFVMTLDASRLLLAFKQPHGLEEIRNILQGLDLVLEEADLGMGQQNPAMLARRTALPKNNHLVAKGSTIVNLKLLKKKEGEEEEQEE